MGIEQVAEIIRKIADGFEDACLQCLEDNAGAVVEAIREQLYSGQDGRGKHLSPTYDDDPFFREQGYWHNRAKAYKAWKNEITPPRANMFFPLDLPPRPQNVPNLFITGRFYTEISAARKGDALVIDPGSGDGPALVSKYGDEILDIGPSAVDFFLTNYLHPAIENFFTDCGYV